MSKKLSDQWLRTRAERELPDWPDGPEQIIREALREYVGDGDGADEAVLAHYTASVLEQAAVQIERERDGVYTQTGHTTEGEDFDAWLAQHDAEVAAKVLNEASYKLERERDVPARAWNFPRFGVSTNLAPGLAWREGMSTCVHWLRWWAEQQEETGV